MCIYKFLNRLCQISLFIKEKAVMRFHGIQAFFFVLSFRTFSLVEKDNLIAGSFGYAAAKFIQENGFRLIPRSFVLDVVVWHHDQPEENAKQQKWQKSNQTNAHQNKAPKVINFFFELHALTAFQKSKSVEKPLSTSSQNCLDDVINDSCQGLYSHDPQRHEQKICSDRFDR